MDNNPKNSGGVRRLIFRLLGPAMSQKIVAWILRNKIDRTPAAFPADLSRSSDILVILPTDRIEMIYQLETIFAIVGKYRDSSFTFVCPAAHAPFVSGFKNARVITFNPEKFLMYGAEHARIIKEMAATRTFDICVILEKQYSLAHLHLIGVSRAHLRVGWDSGNSSPFLNVRLISSEREGANLWERNIETARILNADTETKLIWGVQESTGDDVEKLLSEHRLKPEQALICVDLASLEPACGKEWCAELIKTLRLRESGSGQYCVFGGLEGDNSSFSIDDNAKIAILPPISVTSAAALMTRVALVITGPGALLGLAQISTCKIIPVLTKNQAAKYCMQQPRIAPVILPETQDGKPNSETMGAVMKNVRSMMSSNQ